MRWQRLSPLAGVLAVVGILVGFALNSGSPDTNDSDAKISAYLASHSHQVRGLVGFFLFLAGILFLLVFFWVLRARLAAAEGGPGRLAALAYGCGVASAVLWLAAAIFFTGPSVAANDTSKFHDPSGYRLMSDIGYQFWVAAVVVGALVVWTTSAAILRRGLLPRWFGWLGIPVGVLLLLAVFFIPAFIYMGWIVVTAVLLAWRAGRVRPAAANQPA
jgi:Domain of unknown function (DUF4386)